MEKESRHSNQSGISRRGFLSVGGAAVAGTTLSMRPGSVVEGRERQGGGAKIRKYKTLGRTGFEVSDLAVGGVPLRNTAVVRYAYEKGINYFDVAEGYGRGAAEEAVGEAMQFMDRSKIFITTKIGMGNNDTVETVLDRFGQCLVRMKTDYIDAFYMHGIGSVEALNNPVFHAATDQLKADGKIKFIGFSCHGPRGNRGDSMEDVLLAAAEDGRFDQVLFVYNFMNREVGDKILAALKANNIGTTAMKTAPGMLRPTPFDPENPTGQQTQYIDRMVSRGRSREQAITGLRRQIERQHETYQNTRPFIEKYGIETEEQLRLASIHWVAQNPDMHTTCVGMNDLDIIDKIMPLSGTTLSPADEALLSDYETVLNDKYCRHGCNICADACPNELPVSTIMRYAYYFECQGREKDAMLEYEALDEGDASLCIGCHAPCSGACPYGIDIQSTMLQAHSLLTL